MLLMQLCVWHAVHVSESSPPAEADSAWCQVAGVLVDWVSVITSRDAGVIHSYVESFIHWSAAITSLLDGHAASDQELAQRLVSFCIPLMPAA